MINREEPTRLLVMPVFKRNLAFKNLAAGDKITGANGQALVTPHKFGDGVGKFGYEGPMMDLGNALEESQGKLDGKRVFDILRGERCRQFPQADGSEPLGVESQPVSRRFLLLPA
jgi:hypothetical protein